MTNLDSIFKSRDITRDSTVPQNCDHSQGPRDRGGREESQKPEKEGPWEDHLETDCDL